MNLKESAELLKSLNGLKKEIKDKEVDDALHKVIRYLESSKTMRREEWEKIKQLTFFHVNKAQDDYPEVEIKWVHDDEMYAGDIYYSPSIRVLICYGNYKGEYLRITPSKNKGYVVHHERDPKALSYEKLQNELFVVFEKENLDERVQRVLEILK